MGRKTSQPECPHCRKVAIITDAGEIAFHTRADGSFYCRQFDGEPRGPIPARRTQKAKPVKDQAVSKRPTRPVAPAAERTASTQRAARSSTTAASGSAAGAGKPVRPAALCTGCGATIHAGKTLCVTCRRRIRAAGKAVYGLDPVPTKKKAKVSVPRVWVDPNRSWVLERARDALMTGFGARRNRAGIKELRALVPELVADFEARLPDNHRAALKTDLAARGFRGKNALVEFGQSVVTDIRRQRQGSFRGITRGGLPGTRR